VRIICEILRHMLIMHCVCYLKCVYCRQRGLLVECSRDSCMSAFHVTCGHAVGAKFEVTQSPFAVSVTCSKHKLQSGPSVSLCTCYFVFAYLIECYSY